MELRLNKRVIALPALGPRHPFIYGRGRGGEGFHPASGGQRRRRACHLSAGVGEDVSGRDKCKHAN